jgi:soluble lytic murein transglycosylase-like protein
MSAYRPSRPGREDWREICPCQAHARRERALWRRSLRAVRGLKARSIAVIVGVPLFFGALQMPTEAMDASFIKAGQQSINQLLKASASTTAADFPIFTTDRIRENLLSSEGRPQGFTLEVAKEQFYQAHVPFGSIIYREAKKHNIRPELVAAVVQAESRFMPAARSGAGAVGLMQLIPKTGRWMGARDLTNPSQNISAGTKYLKYLNERFDGNETKVIAAYNAGEGNVQRFGGVPPFKETRNYVEKVRSYEQDFKNRVDSHVLSEPVGLLAEAR